jgi:hypothetical protein
MRELKVPGDPISVGCFCHGVREVQYAMDGGNYMHGRAVAAQGDALFDEARRVGKLNWLVGETIDRGLAIREWPEEHGATACAFILVKAHVTWHHICARKS